MSQDLTIAKRDESVRSTLIWVVDSESDCRCGKTGGRLAERQHQHGGGRLSFADGQCLEHRRPDRPLSAGRPPDEDHPYGHRKFETLAALMIGALLALTAWEVLKSCLERLREGGAPEATPLTFWVMGTTLLINLGVSTWERREGARLKSDLLKADAAHTQSDVYASLAVIASLIAARMGFPNSISWQQS